MANVSDQDLLAALDPPAPRPNLPVIQGIRGQGQPGLRQLRPQLQPRAQAPQAPRPAAQATVGVPRAQHPVPFVVGGGQQQPGQRVPVPQQQQVRLHLVPQQPPPGPPQPPPGPPQAPPGPPQAPPGPPQAPPGPPQPPPSPPAPQPPPVPPQQPPQNPQQPPQGPQQQQGYAALAPQLHQGLVGGGGLQQQAPAPDGLGGGLQDQQQVLGGGGYQQLQGQAGGGVGYQYFQAPAGVYVQHPQAHLGAGGYQGGQGYFVGGQPLFHGHHQQQNFFQPDQVYHQGFAAQHNQGLFQQLYGQQAQNLQQQYGQQAQNLQQQYGQHDQNLQQLYGQKDQNEQTDQNFNKLEISNLIKKEGEKLSLLVDAKLGHVKKADVNFKSIANKERYVKWAAAESKVDLIQIALQHGADHSFISSLLSDLKESTNAHQSDEILEDFSAVNGQKKLQKFKEFKKLKSLGFFQNSADLKLFNEVCKDVDREQHFQQHSNPNQQLYANPNYPNQQFHVNPNQYPGNPIVAFPSPQGGTFSDGKQFSNFLNMGQPAGGQVRFSNQPNSSRYQPGRNNFQRKYPPNPQTDVVGGRFYCDVCLSSATDHYTWLCPSFRRNDVAVNANDGSQQAAVYNRQPLISAAANGQLALPNPAMGQQLALSNPAGAPNSGHQQQNGP